MTTGIIVFAYNRDKHLTKVLEGLRKNREVHEIYVFQDGLNKEEHRKGWEATSKIIHEIDWCKVNYTLADHNKGLSQSILDGVTKILQEKDSVIVLEDDCVPSPNFVSYMLQCLEKYEYYENVYSVTGYSHPMEITKDDFDIYFVGRSSSWGWGTWKDRWNAFQLDGEILDRIKQDKIKSIYLSTWGNDMEQLFKDKWSGRNESWDVCWALYIIEHMGVNVVPYKSFIQNIGMDNSGVHCGVTEQYDVKMEADGEKKYRLPQETIVNENVKNAYLEWYGGYIVNNKDKEKEHIFVYGLGTYFKRNEKYICDNYFIEGFIDNKENGYYAGKKIIKAYDIAEYAPCKIWIMILDIQECYKVAHELENKYKVSAENIWITGKAYLI